MIQTRFQKPSFLSTRLSKFDSIALRIFSDFRNSPIFSWLFDFTQWCKSNLLITKFVDVFLDLALQFSFYPWTTYLKIRHFNLFLLQLSVFNPNNTFQPLTFYWFWSSTFLFNEIIHRFLFAFIQMVYWINYSFHS